MVTFTKIQVIKLLRDCVPGMGLKEAKDVVDQYESKGFEDRVARAMGEDVRGELRAWAHMYVAKEQRMVEPIDYEIYEEDPYEDPHCGCGLCVQL